MLLNAGFMYDRGDYPLHHPNAQFDENVCVIGAACFFERHLLCVVSKKCLQPLYNLANIKYNISKIVK